ncbi:uncharacterized protein EV420DRAFT_1477013 [Desarmillaria tabescens]|uniref:Uncharacterized protein n=1 Tax=Armillaria tabescens TaxID=1929756 RepID=A0AA39NAX3_ARMTA|nr:uncharacterized protein EV420DRAFT_1477013 [Desarmillaria tabescens]KAK0462261.1 hypothetical protein EV420DRAFT_1477013 [Desarmillaria tabescens]
MVQVVADDLLKKKNVDVSDHSAGGSIASNQFCFIIIAEVEYAPTSVALVQPNETGHGLQLSKSRNTSSFTTLALMASDAHISTHTTVRSCRRHDDRRHHITSYDIDQTFKGTGKSIADDTTSNVWDSLAPECDNSAYIQVLGIGTGATVPKSTLFAASLLPVRREDEQCATSQTLTWIPAPVAFKVVYLGKAQFVQSHLVYYRQTSRASTQRASSHRKDWPPYLPARATVHTIPIDCFTGAAISDPVAIVAYLDETIIRTTEVRSHEGEQIPAKQPYNVAWALLFFSRSLMRIRNWDPTVELAEKAPRDQNKEVQGVSYADSAGDGIAKVAAWKKHADHREEPSPSCIRK